MLSWQHERMTVNIRRAAPDDAAALSLVGAATFLDAFAGILDGKDIVAHCARHHAASVYQKYLAAPSAALWIAETDEGAAPVGYALLNTPELPEVPTQADDLEVKRIYVLSRFHGGGVGPRLMTVAIDEARVRGAGRALLGVYAGNERALAFYKKHGFERIGQRVFTVGARRCDDFILARGLA